MDEIETEEEKQERLAREEKERLAREEKERQQTTGVFPHAKPEDRYQGMPGTTPPHPPTSPPPATVPAAADPNALPSNVRQFEEVYEREKEEMMKAPAFRGATIGTPDEHFQQPGAPSQQIVKPGEPREPVLSEQTKAEQAAGQKAVAAVGQRQSAPGTATGAIEGETAEQLEEKRKEAEEREKTWGAPGTIAGSPR
jgi:hypothetical protein